MGISNLFRGLTWDFEVVRRIADDSTISYIASKASWERNELKTERIWVHFQHISGFLLGYFLAKKFAMNVALY